MEISDSMEVDDPGGQSGASSGLTPGQPILSVPVVSDQQPRRVWKSDPESAEARAAREEFWRARRGVVARGDQRCLICGLRWQRSERVQAGGTVYMFPFPSGSEWQRWKLCLKLPGRPVPRRNDRICSLHFRPGETRVQLVDGVRVAHTLPVAAPKRNHFDERSRAPVRACSFPLCRGLRQGLLQVLIDIQQRGSALLRRAARPYWSRRRFALPELSPTNQAWVELFSEALNGRPNLPDQVELASLCALHFTPNWFRWENRGRPRLLDDPLGDPKLDKYAEPTIFSSSALIRALRMALDEDIAKQAEQREAARSSKPPAAPAPTVPPPPPVNRQSTSKIRCGYPYCEGGTILFPLPAERDQRKLWLRSLSAVLIAFGEPPGFDIKACTHLCSFHFNEEEIEDEEDGTITLSAEAVPSRFNRPSVQPDEPPPAEQEPIIKPISWPEQLSGFITEAASQLWQQQQEQQEEVASSEEEVVDVEEDSGFLPRLELQIAVDPGASASTADGEFAEGGDDQGGEGGLHHHHHQQLPLTDDDDEVLENGDEVWRPNGIGLTRSKLRGRGRGRSRGRGRGRGSAMRDIPSPIPPPPAQVAAESVAESQAGDVVRQAAALADSALAGHWPALRAVDTLRGAVYPLTAGLQAQTETTDQLLKLCLLRRLRRAAAQAAEAAVSEEPLSQQLHIQQLEPVAEAVAPIP